MVALVVVKGFHSFRRRSLHVFTESIESFLSPVLNGSTFFLFIWKMAETKKAQDFTVTAIQHVDQILYFPSKAEFLKWKLQFYKLGIFSPGLPPPSVDERTESAYSTLVSRVQVAAN